MSKSQNSINFNFIRWLAEKYIFLKKNAPASLQIDQRLKQI